MLKYPAIHVLTLIFLSHSFLFWFIFFTGFSFSRFFSSLFFWFTHSSVMSSMLYTSTFTSSSSRFSPSFTSSSCYDLHFHFDVFLSCSSSFINSFLFLLIVFTVLLVSLSLLSLLLFIYFNSFFYKCSTLSLPLFYVFFFFLLYPFVSIYRESIL